MLAGRLVYELADVVGPHRVAAAQSPVVRGRSPLGHGAEGREPCAGIGLGRKRFGAPGGGEQLAVAKRWRGLSRRERRTQNPARATATDCDRVPIRAVRLIERLMAGESRPTQQLQRDRARRRSDLQNAAGRDPLERSRKQHLQAAAKLEVLGIHPMGRLLAADSHDSNACSRIAACSDAYPSRSPGYQRLTPSRSIAGRSVWSS